MKVTYSWLKEFVEFDASPEKLGEMLSMAGLSVASLERAADDWVYDIEVTSNRPDWLSVRGIAAEVAAITGGRLKKPVHLSPAASGRRKKPGKLFSIRIDDKKGCSLYCGSLIKDVKVGESPEWLKKKLTAVGLRPSNNVVDITNYCLMESGQPLHAFDFDKLAGTMVVVRRAQEGESLTLIDGSEKKLKDQVLVIADSARPIAAAGIMGGRSTEVSLRTVNVLLESACFDPVVVRRGARFLGVASDSSYRFERGVDVAAVKAASDYAVKMICELCGGALVSSQQAGSAGNVKTRKVAFAMSDVRDVLSVDIPGQKVKAILERLGFGVRRKAKEVFEVSVPSFRRDVRIPEDLTEEIARVHGYDRIPLTAPAIKPFTLEVPPTQALEPALKALLTAAGLKEVITYSLVSPEDYRKSGVGLTKDARTLENPLSQDFGVLRTTLLPSLLGCASFNINHNNRDFEIFEISRVFAGQKERVSLGIALCGMRRAAWLKESGAYGLFDLKGILETILDELRVEGPVFQEAEEGFAEKGTACRVAAAGQTVAVFGKVSSEVKRNYGLKGKEDVFVAEVSVEALAQLARLKKSFKEIGATPSVFRDASLLAPPGVSYAKIKDLIEQKAKTYIRNISLADCYHGREIPAGHAGLTVSIEYGLKEKTLTDGEVNAVHQKVLAGLVEELELELR